MKAAVAKDAIPRANMVCLTGDAMRVVLDSFYSVLEGFNVKLIGGATPGEDFYYGATDGANAAVIGGADGPTAIVVTEDGADVAVIGGADGPTAIFVTEKKGE